MVADSQDGVRLEISDRVAHVVFDLPDERVNKLSRRVLTALSEILGEIEAAPAPRGVLIRSGKDGVFLAGADVSEIEAITDHRLALAAAHEGQSLMGRVESLPVPVVAAIGGVCLGGGTELALACDARIGSDHPRFQMGLPEVKLGLIPGWGGTTRLPRLIGLTPALAMILAGRAADSRRALKLGLVDRVVAHVQLVDRALELLQSVADGDRPRRPKRRLSERLVESNPVGRFIVFAKARHDVVKKTGGHYPAPLAAIEIMRQGFGSSSRSLELEAEKLSELLPTPVSKNLIELFFAVERSKKDLGSASNLDDLAGFEHAGLIGAGTMGGGIASLLASRELSVRLKDLNREALGLGLRQARAVFERRRKKKRMTAWRLQQSMGRITPTLDWSGFAAADLVIEAIVEDMEIKKTLLQEIEPVLTPGCVVASNTSTLSISEMQSVLSHPERFAGLHFFNPVHKMPLVEVIRGAKTSDQTVARLMRLAQRLGKTPVAVADGPGFLVNRILGPYLNEAGHLLLQTGAPLEIERVVKAFGMPMGPLRLLDEVGIDVAQKAGKTLSESFGERVEPSTVLQRLAQAGRLGKKTKHGFYRYSGKQESIEHDLGQLLGVSHETLSDAEILNRCVHLMVAEASRCLEESIVRSAADLDLAMVMGTGFPPFRGGLLRYADAYGVRRIVDELSEFQTRLGPRFAPPEALGAVAQQGGFYRS